MKHSSASFSQDKRLKRPSDFQRVYNNKQWGGSRYFTYNVMANTLDYSVLGVTVSKKVSKRAVDRNRIKRQIKEYFRLHQEDIKSADIVITAKASCLAASDEQRQASLADLWQKLLKWQRWNAHQKRKEFDES